MLTKPVFAGFTSFSVGTPTCPVLSGAGRSLDAFCPSCPFCPNVDEDDSSGSRELSAGVVTGAALVVGTDAAGAVASVELLEAAGAFGFCALAA